MEETLMESAEEQRCRGSMKLGALHGTIISEFDYILL
jgi:hypothetical protein